MKVVSAPGTKTPIEDNPRKYILDEQTYKAQGTDPVDVPDNSSYYRRLIRDGSLISAEAGKRGSADVGAIRRVAQKEKGGKS